MTSALAVQSDDMVSLFSASSFGLVFRFFRNAGLAKMPEILELAAQFDLCGLLV
jgi:hypothetical protein